MQLFETWNAVSDKKSDHLLVSDDEDASQLGLAHIDYAFALSFEWIGVSGTVSTRAPRYPPGVPVDPMAMEAVTSAIEGLEEARIMEIVSRIPAAYFIDGAREAIITNLLQRQASSGRSLDSLEDEMSGAQITRRLAVRPTPQVQTVQDLFAPDAPLYDRSEVHGLNPEKVAIV